MPRRPTFDPARLLGVLVLCFAGLAVMGGGTCVWIDDDDSRCFDDDDDNDQGCDDDDFLTTGPREIIPGPADINKKLADLGAGQAAQPGEWSGVSFPELKAGDTILTEYVVDLAQEAGRHPVARVRDIRHLSVFDMTTHGLAGSQDFTRFSQEVLDANPELLGLPEAAGHLRPRSVHFLDDLVVIAHEQVAGSPQDLDAPAIPGAELLFVFDMLGRLHQIENRTVLPTGIVVTVAPELLRTQ